MANWASKNDIYTLLSPVVNEENKIVGLNSKTTPSNFNFGPLDKNLDIVLGNLSQELKNNPHVMYGTGSEAHHISMEKLVKKQKELINIIHANSPNAIVVVNGLGWGSVLTDYLKSPINLPNVLYEVHRYPNENKKNINFDECKIAPEEIGKLPLLLSEFGGVYGADFSSVEDLKCIDNFYINIAQNKINFAMYTIDPGTDLSITDENNELTTKGKNFVEALKKIKTTSYDNIN